MIVGNESLDLTVQNPGMRWVSYGQLVRYNYTGIHKQGNRLTRRPYKGDEFEILIFEGKRQNAGICRSRQKMFATATWTFISIGRRVTQE